MFEWIEKAVEAVAWGFSAMIITIGTLVVVKIGLRMFRRDSI
ncbi:MAG: hypothetical protein OEZ40_01550 [Candidatus Bathyarchaeota archaeon]|nr:hypothetical protein [Candidatus Bathyarchaeota archaeon]